MKNFLKKFVTLGLLAFLLAGLTSLAIAAAQSTDAAEEQKQVHKQEAPFAHARLIAEDPPKPATDKPTDPAKPDAKPAAQPGAPGAAGTPGAAVTQPPGVPSADQERATADEITHNLSKLFAFILQGISKLMLPVIMLSGALMKSDFLFSGTMNETLLEIWDQVRDIVNVIFVVLLVVVALYNVLGLGESSEVGGFLQLKKALPKLVLGLVLVNFSYLGIRVLVDVVNVGTSIAFSIPNSTVLPAKVKSELQGDATIHAICTITKDSKRLADQASKGGLLELAEDANKKTQKQICKNGKIDEDTLKKLTEWGIDGAVPVMALKFMNLQKLDKISDQLSTQGGGVTKLVLNMLVSIVMYLLYGASFVALFTILLARAVLLWLVIALSPVIAIQATFPQILSKAGGGDYAGKIIKTLIAPMIIGFVLSVGFMILATMQQVDFSKTTLDSLSLTTSAADLQTSNLDTFQQLLISIGAVVFIFVGVQSAISDAIGGEIAGTIMSTAKRAGGWLARAPFMYTPLFPVKTPDGGHHDVSAAGLLKTISRVADAPERAAEETPAKLFPFLKGGADSELDRIKTGDDLNKFADIIHSNNPSDLAKSENMIKAIDRMFQTEGKLQNYDHLKKLMRDYKEAKTPDEKERIIKDMRDEMGRKGLTGAGEASALDTAKAEIPALLQLNPPNADKIKKLEEDLKKGTVKAENLEKHGGYGAYQHAKQMKEAKDKLQAGGLQNELAAVKDASDASAETKAVDDLVKKVDAEKDELKKAGFTDEKDQKEILVKIIDQSGLDDAKKKKVAEALKKKGGVEKAIGEELVPPETPAATQPPATGNAPAPAAPTATPRPVAAPTQPAPAQPSQPTPQPSPPRPTPPPAAQPPSPRPPPPTQPPPPAGGAPSGNQ